MRGRGPRESRPSVVSNAVHSSPMSFRFLVLLFVGALAGCSTDDSHRDRPETARGETPIRYVICSAGGGSCFVSARFNDFDSCESHKKWSGMLCDSASEPGKMVCTPGDNSIAVAYCTK